MDPLVSVIIIAYNFEWCIKDAIASVLAQTYPRTEVIVVDDASNDRTADAVVSFGSRVKLIRNSRRTSNAGLNRNTGIQAASGEYIAFLDGDDLWEPEKLVVQMTAAAQYPAAGLVAVDGIQFRHEDGAMLKPSLYHTIPWRSSAELQVLNLYDRLLHGCCIETPSQILVRRAVLDAVGGFTGDLHPRPGGGRGEDYDLLLKIAARFNFTLSRRSLVRYRYHSSALSALGQQNDLYFAITDLGILQRQLAWANVGYRERIETLLRHKFRYSCRQAAARGRAGRRLWASRYLMRLLHSHVTPANAVYASISLARVWYPNVLSRAVGNVRRLWRTP